MGSFYATCSITDLSITDGDSTYMQLITPTWVTNPHSIDGESVGCSEKGLRVSNDGAMAEFVPFGFPIKGKYADYGNIDEIERDKNVEMLEKFFNLTIEEIIECATDDRWYSYGYKEPDVNDDWIVGDNKMKNIEILKQLTVSYFRKEHYDFLSAEFVEIDSFYIDSFNESLKTMKKLLGKIEKVRPSYDEPVSFKKENITDDMRKKYSVIRNEETDEEFDELIILMSNHKADMWWEHDWNYKFYIPNISKRNMFKILPIGVDQYEDVEKQYKFLCNLRALYKVLRPSYYGSQEDNFAMYDKFHRFSIGLVNSAIIEREKNTILWEVSYALKRGLKGMSKEKVAKIYEIINAELAEYGHKLK